MAMPDAQDPDAPRWHLHLDGVLFGTVNDQGGPRGQTQFRSQNWGMGMVARQINHSTVTLTVMMTAEPLTVGLAGYSELFQEGEAYHGLQVTDRQHPHDLFAQLAGSWRIPVGEKTSVTIAGGPVGEAALGPVAFMHRPSSAENPTAPLSHHIFDSTHIADGVVLGRLDRGVFALEGSVFRGREPDEDRDDLDLGRLDSWSVRGWIRPSPEWTIQLSHGFLHQPEQLEPGDQRRTNGSIAWFRQRGSNYAAVMVAAGRTQRTYSRVGAVLAEGTEHIGRSSVYGRFERVSVETEILLFPEVVHHPHPGELVDPVTAYTAGGVRDVARIRGLLVGLGSDITLYQPPPLLQITHGSHPVSFHVFVRIARPPDRRMWNMTMGSPDIMPASHSMAGMGASGGGL